MVLRERHFYNHLTWELPWVCHSKEGSVSKVSVFCWDVYVYMAQHSTGQKTWGRSKLYSCGTVAICCSGWIRQGRISQTILLLLDKIPLHCSGLSQVAILCALGPTLLYSTLNGIALELNVSTSSLSCYPFSMKDPEGFLDPSVITI